MRIYIWLDRLAKREHSRGIHKRVQEEADDTSEDGGMLKACDTNGDYGTRSAKERGCTQYSVI